MKLRLLRLITAAVLLICVSFLGYRSYLWWQKQQKKKELFIYVQQKSPVTRRIPADAVFYANLYDFKRVHSELQGTRLNEVLSHWMDTGMSDAQKPNPMLGGMLEKTILNVIGEEFGIAFIPSGRKTLDYVAVARLTPGSEFFLKLALASSKNARQLDLKGETVYSFETKHPDYPEVYVFVSNDFAYSSSNLQRIQQASDGQNQGPEFLRDTSIEPIPEDTFLFARTKDPEVLMLIHGERSRYHFTVKGLPSLEGEVPTFRSNEQNIISLQTNGTKLLQQPPASYSLQNIAGRPVSAVLLAFETAENTKDYQTRIHQYLGQNVPPEAIEEFSISGIQCHRYIQSEQYICTRGLNLLLAQGEFELSTAEFVTGNTNSQTPLTLKIDFHPEPIQEYLQRIERKDWSRFPEAKAFYFLSCIKGIEGRIDGTGNTITAVLE